MRLGRRCGETKTPGSEDEACGKDACEDRDNIWWLAAPWLAVVGWRGECASARGVSAAELPTDGAMELGRVYRPGVTLLDGLFG